MTIVREQPKAPLQAFLAWGFVLAERLPDHADLGRVRITRVAGDRLVGLRRARPLLKHPENADLFSSALPPDFIVQSEWSIWIRVDAETDEEALDRIRSTLLPPALTALEVLSGRPVVVELLRIGVEDEKGHVNEPRSPYSLSGFFSPYAQPSTMSSDEIRSADEVATLVGSNSTLLAAARGLFEADRLQASSGGVPRAIGAALLQYFHVIEMVSTKVAVPESLDADERREKVLSRLMRGLTANGTVRNKAAQVRNSATELNRIDHAYLTLRIENAGRVLEIESNAVSSALALAKLRNTKLSHPGSLGADIQVHVESARAAAKAYLLGAVAARI